MNDRTFLTFLGACFGVAFAAIVVGALRQSGRRAAPQPAPAPIVEVRVTLVVEDARAPQSGPVWLCQHQGCSVDVEHGHR